MFYLSHSEFPHSKQPLLRVNFISETETNLSSSEGHSVIIEFQESSEVYEDTLGSLRPQITLSLTRGTNLGAEHEVEGLSFRDFIAGVWVLYLKFLNHSIQRHCVH